MSSVQGLADYVEARRRDVDAALGRFLTGPPACPPVVAEAMRYSLFAGGKRLRPILTLAAAEAVAERIAGTKEAAAGPSPSSVPLALPAACAIEMIHTYSLIHDDLPAMDDDALRRGRPTSHVVFGEGIAILAGDALLTEAFRLLATEPAGGDLAARKLRVIALVGEAAGADGMVGGQAIDLQASGSGKGDPASGRMNADTLQAMHARKTGALIRAAAGAGAIMAGGSDDLIAATDRYATELGLAFQIVDDILDVEGAAEDIGKTAGKDAAAGKPTYPALHGLEVSRRLAADCIARARASLADAKLGGQLPALADWVVRRNK